MLNAKASLHPQAGVRIPVELSATDRFHNWSYYQPKPEDKPRKSPVIGDGILVGYNDPRLPKPLDQALKQCHAADFGLGLTLADGLQMTCEGHLGYLWCIDYDGFAEINGSNVDDGVFEQLDRTNSYTEMSPSMTGFKVFFVSNKEPTKKIKILFSPSSFAEAHPDIQKYIDRAIEIFSMNTFLAVTGEYFTNSAYKTLRFIPESELDQILSELERYALEGGGIGRHGVKQPKQSQSSPAHDGLVSYAKLEPESLKLVLTHIDADNEQIWTDVANALSRAYGESGRHAFHTYSERSDKYDPEVIDSRYDRALKELSAHPSGYGVKHLIELAKASPCWREQPLNFEGDSARLMKEPPICAPVTNYAQGITAAELSAKTFQPLMWIVNGILPEGCYLLSARPKVGKSWLALQISLAVAYGTPTLGRTVVKGKAVYLALEENQRRLQDRLKLLRPQGYATDDLRLFTEWPAFDNGGAGKADRPDPRRKTQATCN